MTRLTTCSTCEGLGEWDEGPINCGGPAGGISPEYRQVKCPDCDGTGKVEEADIPRDELDELDRHVWGSPSPTLIYGEPT